MEELKRSVIPGKEECLWEGEEIVEVKWMSDRDWFAHPPKEGAHVILVQLWFHSDSWPEGDSWQGSTSPKPERSD